MEEIKQRLAKPFLNEKQLCFEIDQCTMDLLTVSKAYRAAQATLARHKGQAWNPSLSSDKTRQIDMEFRVADQQREVDELSDIADILKLRIALGMAMLEAVK